MTEDFLENYFLNVATQLIAIAHTPQKKAFYRIHSKMDLDEFDNAVRDMQSSSCLLVEFGSGSIGDWDSPKDSMRIGLHILNKSSEKFSEIKQARDSAKIVLLKIVARIRKDVQDRYHYSDQSAGPLKLAGIVFDTNLKYDDMDAVDGNWYGKSLYFDFKAPISLAYNTDDYLP